jgi:hypothetical protein
MRIDQTSQAFTPEIFVLEYELAPSIEAMISGLYTLAAQDVP